MLLIIRPAGIQRELVIRENFNLSSSEKECHSPDTKILNQFFFLKKKKENQKEIIFLKNLISILPKEIG